MSQNSTGLETASSILTKARSLTVDYSCKQLYSTALYWADKAFSLSEGQPEDLQRYVQALYHCKQYHRAANTLHGSGLLSRSPELCYLTARCHAACEEWEEVVSLLAPPQEPLPDQVPPDTPSPQAKGNTSVLTLPSLGNIEASAHVLRGQAQGALGDLHSSLESYRQALTADVFCEEALERLCAQNCLTPEEEKSLMDALPFKTQCTPLEEKTLRYLYVQKLQHCRSSHLPLLQHAVGEELDSKLSTNTDVMCGRAEELFQQQNMNACYQITSSILDADPYHDKAITLHTASCAQKNKFEELYSLGHRLVDSSPSSALSWYVVGCYYITINKHQSARKYLTKSLTLDTNFGPAHIAFGLSFAGEGEHDQAISAFSNAARVMKGSHLPLLYLGKEYFLTGAISTSTKFMKAAYDLAPADPLLLHEIGYVVASLGIYVKAERYFKQALAQLKMVDAHLTLPAWEPVYNNLGHVLRKQGKYDEALSCHFNSLQLSPHNSSTLTAIAFLYLLQGQFNLVVEYANQSLKIKREDQFTLEVLHSAMMEAGDVGADEWMLPLPSSIPNLEGMDDELEPKLKMIFTPVGGFAGVVVGEESGGVAVGDEPEVKMNVN